MRNRILFHLTNLIKNPHPNKKKFSYKILPPSNHFNITVGVLDPMPYDRSTKRVAKSAYKMVTNVGWHALIKVEMHPMNRRNESHFEANRY